MVDFASADMDRQDLYKLLIGSVVPRPIAWVASKGHDGVANLAPFSFFNAIGAHPPMLAFSCSDRGDEMKDTSRNIQERPEYVVHIVSEELAERMNVTCGDFGADVDEFAEAGLTAVPGTAVDVPRVAEALVAMECRVLHHLRLGDGRLTSHIVGEVVHWHINDRVLMERNRIDPDVLQAVGRMGGIEYARTGDRLSIARPVVEATDPRSIPSAKARAQEAAPRPRAGD